jgi:hypothetical protein
MFTVNPTGHVIPAQSFLPYWTTSGPKSLPFGACIRWVAAVSVLGKIEIQL